jgi:K+-sensing histidine kinase KdpD
MQWLPSGMQPVLNVKPVFVIRDFLQALRVDSAGLARPRAESSGTLRSILRMIGHSDSATEMKLFFDAVECDENTQIEVRGQMLEWCLSRIIENSSRHKANTLRLVIKNRDEDHVLITVSDDGEGLPPDRNPKDLYEWKKQWDVQGRGTALPMCRHFVKSMNGEIWSERSDPNGLTTSIVFPSWIPE